MKLRAGTVNLARLMSWGPRATKVIHEIDSMELELIGFQETPESFEADLAQRLAGDWFTASDHVNCPTFARVDLFETASHNGQTAIRITMPGSVRDRFGSAALLKRKADGLTFVFADIHPSNPSESSHSAQDRIKQAESCWQQLEAWGVTDYPIFLLGDMNTKDMPPKGLPGVFVSHGMTDMLQALKQKGRIDRAFLLGLTPISATVNPVASSESDHDFGIFEAEPIIAPPDPPEVRLHGVDVSSYQKGWTPAPSDSFVFVKATQGTGYANPEAVDQLAAGRAADLQIGHYHYLNANNAVPQARYFVDQADIHSGDLLACDWEGIWKSGGHPSVEDAAQFIAEVKRLCPENKVGLYCNRSDWTSTTVKAGDFLWVAEYGVKAPATKTDWAFWQYTDKPLDMNLSRFETLNELKTWARETPPPIEKPVLPTVQHSAKYNADYMTWKGEGWVTVKDHAILTALDEESMPFWRGLHLTQGGLSTSVAASANTHAGLGCFDVRTKNNSKDEVWELASMFLRSGMVFFPRGYVADSFQDAKHGHVVSRESYDSLHPSAKAQYREYIAGGDGLVGSAKYTGPSTPFERWTTSPYNGANITEGAQTYWVSVADGFLWGLDVDRKKVTTRDKGAAVVSDCRVERWGRSNAVTPEDVYFAMDYLTTTKPEVAV